uniref:Uncharacterized protein n=1 Tax=Romanomermis culicivorax TaxID=13658 RepID=A0A915KFS8_ROMCU
MLPRWSKRQSKGWVSVGSCPSGSAWLTRMVATNRDSSHCGALIIITPSSSTINKRHNEMTR